MTYGKLARLGTSLVVATALAVGLGACSGTNGGSAGGHRVVVGHIAQLTGAAQQNGVQFEAGVRSALDQIRTSGLLPADLELDVITEDDGTQVDRAAQHFAEMVSRNHVDAVLSSGWTPITTALWPLANDSKVPLVAASTLGGAAHQADYFFSMLDLPSVPRLLSEDLVATGKSRVGLLLDGDNPGFKLMSTPLDQALRAKNVPGFVSVQTVSTGDTDFSAVLANFANAGVDSIVMMVAPGAVGNFVVQARRVPALADATLLTHHAISTTLANVAGPDAVGVIFPQAWIAKGEPVAAAFQKQTGSQATAWFAYGHDALWMVAVAAVLATREGQEVNGDAIRARIPQATRSPEFEKNQLATGFTMAADGTASTQAQLATFDASGNVVPAHR